MYLRHLYCNTWCKRCLGVHNHVVSFPLMTMLMCVTVWTLAGVVPSTPSTGRTTLRWEVGQASGWRTPLHASPWTTCATLTPGSTVAVSTSRSPPPATPRSTSPSYVSSPLLTNGNANNTH